MNVVKRRWPDLLIALLVLLLLGGFAALLLGKDRTGTAQSGAVQSAGAAPQGTTQDEGAPTTQGGKTQTPESQAPVAQAPVTQAPDTQAPSSTGNPDSSGTEAGTAQAGGPESGTTPAGTIPTIPSAPITAPSTAPQATPPQAVTPADTASPPVATDTPTTVSPQAGGSIPTSAARVPTRNDYRISLGSYANDAALQAATVGVNKLGYTVYPISVASGMVAQVGPFATREAAAQALSDIQRALPQALVYPPRNAPASDTAAGASGTAAPQNPASGTAASDTTTSPKSQASGSELAASGPVYLQVGAYKSVKAAQTAVGRVRGLGLEPSVNAPAGKLVTVVVGPYQGQALTDAEARLQSGGIDSFRVR